MFSVTTSSVKPNEQEPWTNCKNLISGVMVCMLISNNVDCGFEQQSGQTKDYNVGICCISAKLNHATVGVNTGWLEIRIMCSSVVTCLSKDSSFSELAP